jgi:plastocyanin
MRLRTLLLFALVAVMGAAVAVIPALAASEATVEVSDCTAWPGYSCWTQSNVTIASGGSVKFIDKSSTLEQGVEWEGTAPACEKVPATTTKGPWEGTCTFATPGTYRFDGTQSPNYAGSGEVTVSGTSSTTTTGTTGMTQSTPSGSYGSSTTSSGSGSGSPQSGAPAGGATPLGSLFVGSASSACKLSSAQHGQSVHGSLDVSQAGAGARLEVQLLATRASLADAGHSSRVQVGRLVRSSVRAGTDTFTVPVSAKARHALRAHGHLALTVKVLLSSAHGSAGTLTRSVVLHA